ncbi:MAG: hypothetical protein IJU58_03100 [Clostridia bacterium]|nr:hypothetical protein [Clostridia bacterium]
MELTKDKHQLIKNIVNPSEDCPMLDVEFVQLKDNEHMIVVPVLYTQDHATFEDLYTQKKYTRQSRYFGSVATAEKLCDIYEYEHKVLTNPKFRVLGNMIGASNAMKEFYQKYNIGSNLDYDYARITKRLKLYNYESKEQRSNIIKLAKDIQTFLGGASFIKEKVKTIDHSTEEMQMSM